MSRGLSPVRESVGELGPGRGQCYPGEVDSCQERWAVASPSTTGGSQEALRRLSGGSQEVPRRGTETDKILEISFWGMKPKSLR